MSAWSQGILERTANTADRCHARAADSRDLLTGTRQMLIASRRVRTRVIMERSAQNARNFHATECPVTPFVTFATKRPGTTYVPVDDRTVIAANLRNARLDLDLSLDKLAGRIGKTRREIVRWEKGAGKGAVRPSHDNLVALAEALERDVFWFYQPHAAEDAELAS